MVIALDTSPISGDSLHKVRGVGSYINLLVKNLKKYDSKNQYLFVNDGNYSSADVVHIPYFDPFSNTIPHQFEKKLVVTVHDLIPIVFPKHFPSGLRGKLAWYHQKKKLRSASSIITDSVCSKNDIVKYTGIKQGAIDVVYLSVDSSFQKLKPGNWESDIKKKFNLPSSFLLYVGDATWNKNLPKIIDVVKKINIPLVMVGKVLGQDLVSVSDNPWNRDLIKVIKDIENDKRFLRLGFLEQEDLVKIYNLATALFMPSLYEGFGLPVLEAMASGCPVITSKEGSLPEIAGEAVQYVNAYDEDEMLKVIRILIEDASLRSNLTKKGLMQANQFSIEKTIKDTVSVYESVINS